MVLTYKLIIHSNITQHKKIIREGSIFIFLKHLSLLRTTLGGMCGSRIILYAESLTLCQLMDLRALSVCLGNRCNQSLY